MIDRGKQYGAILIAHPRTPADLPALLENILKNNFGIACERSVIYPYLHTEKRYQEIITQGIRTLSEQRKALITIVHLNWCADMPTPPSRTRTLDITMDGTEASVRNALIAILRSFSPANT